MIKEEIINEIKKNIKNVELEIFTNDDKYFNAVIITDEFENRDLLDRQKIIYKIIEKYILNKSVHAISFKTYTKQEWLSFKK